MTWNLKIKNNQVKSSGLVLKYIFTYISDNQHHCILHLKVDRDMLDSLTNLNILSLERKLIALPIEDPNFVSEMENFHI